MYMVICKTERTYFDKLAAKANASVIFRKLYESKSYIWLTRRKKSLHFICNVSSSCFSSHWDKMSSAKHCIIIIMVWMVRLVNSKTNQYTSKQTKPPKITNVFFRKATGR